MNSSTLLSVLLSVALVGCNRSTSPPPQVANKPVTPPIAGVPVHLTVSQRSTTEIPGTDGRLSLTVDDVTRGQIMVSVVRSGAAPLLGPVSMKSGDARDLQIDGVDYTLRLTELNNVLIGEDSATLSLDACVSSSMTESEKIDRLIQDVEAMEGAIFIRNGQEYTPQEAAMHLRKKVEAAGTELKTAEQFIDQVASRSSLSGEEYQIRTKDGVTVPAGELLREQLTTIAKGD